MVLIDSLTRVPASVSASGQIRIPIAKPLLGDEEKNAVLEVLSSGMLVQGEKVAAFEKAFANFIGVKHAIATSNGTTALHAALLAHGISRGDEVITTPFSFIATANAIVMCGATPVFVDIETDTFNIDPDLIEAAITEKTRAILPVHLFGKSCNMKKIMDIAQKRKLMVIEDACQAHGAEFAGQRVGSFGTGCFSFYGTKNMTTGEGGMITTNDSQLAARLRKIISHSSEKKYVHSSLGYNYRMTDIAAAIGLEQLKKLSKFTAVRKENARKLTAQLSAILGIIPPDLISSTINQVTNQTANVVINLRANEHVFHQYTIRITNDFPLAREQLIEQLSLHGIGSAIFYPIPIHQQEAYASYNHLSFPIAEKAAKEVLSLPVHPGVAETDIEFMGRVLKDCSNQRNSSKRGEDLIQ